MVREIKFRAWSKEEEKMYEVFSFCKDFVKVVAEGIGDGVLKFQMKDFEIMQYTGIKDKNGTEIYEGDQDGYGNTVEFSFGCWNLNGDRPLSSSNFEVNGNRYEKPELVSDRQ